MIPPAGMTACSISPSSGCREGLGRVYPGYGTGVGYWEGYTGYYQDPSQYPYLVIIQASGPTHGRMKAILKDMMRFLRYGLELTLELTSE